MQDFKTGMGRRVCRDPDKVFANNYLLESRLLQLRVAHGLQTLRELFPASQDRGLMYDDVVEDCVLLGRGRYVTTQADKSQVKDSAELLIRTLHPPGWGVSDVGAALLASAPRRALSFTSARCREDVVSCSGRASTRDNHWVQVEYETQPVPYVGMVRKLVKITHQSRPDVAPLRLALCDLYRPLQAGSQGSLICTRSVPSHKFYPVPIEVIQAKMVCFRATRQLRGDLFFMPCTNLTRRGARMS
jgi:hypothetical protein